MGYNGVDRSSRSNASQISRLSTGDVSLPGKPDPPSKVNEGTTGGKLSIQWNPPLDRGGLPITGYKVFLSGEENVQLASDDNSNLGILLYTGPAEQTNLIQ